MFAAIKENGTARLSRFVQEYHPIVHVLLIGTVLARAASSMSMPFLAIYLSRDPALSPLLIGAIVGLGSLAGTAGGFVGGALSDRLGRKRILLIALFGWVVVFGGFAIAKAPILFMLLNMLNGLCRSLYEPVSQALMADVTEKSKRLKVFSLRYIAINVGVAVGPLVGAYFGTMQASLPFMITSGIYLFYMIVLYVLLQWFGIRRIEGEQRSGITVRAACGVIVKDKVFRFYTAGAIVGAVGYSQMTVSLSQYVEKSVTEGAALFALLMSLNAVTVVILQVPLSRLFEKFGPMTAIAVGSCMFAAGDVGYALSSGWTSFMISMFLFTIGEILTYPAGNVLIDRLAPEGMRGTYFGAQSFSSIGHFAGPLIGGYMLARWSGETLFSLMAAVTLSGTYFYWKGQEMTKIVHKTHKNSEK
ncbi:MFS transporter [Paenibacillus filicis]|uniref:MFS transporter n=1 Tax=Paenibacillus gyeongsangnamensis TaxID=3388067 RepID=A0ABT4Q5F6_9BACL|nr:MFS transporter [Paenibacillus filicis]MCZ8512031.1 MFS transporter [Paenibacillus filicis]